MQFDEFDRIMRRFEQSLDERYPGSGFVVLRLDGRGFTKLTKETLAFDRPFDDRFHAAMTKTGEHLMQAGLRFQLCYTQSDEISLLMESGEAPFSRKTRKVNSIMAGEASGIFSLAVGHPVAFDCRVCPLPSLDDVVDYFRWRAEDAKRNALSAYCYWLLRQKGMNPSEADAVLDGLSRVRKTELLAENGTRFNEQDCWKRFGALLCWKTVAHAGVNPKTEKPVQTTRRRLEWIDPMPEGEELSIFLRELIQTRPAQAG